jgi:hypothetical protein
VKKIAEPRLQLVDLIHQSSLSDGRRLGDKVTSLAKTTRVAAMETIVTNTGLRASIRLATLTAKQLGERTTLGASKVGGTLGFIPLAEQREEHYQTDKPCDGTKKFKLVLPKELQALEQVGLHRIGSRPKCGSHYVLGCSNVQQPGTSKDQPPQGLFEQTEERDTHVNVPRGRVWDRSKVGGGAAVTAPTITISATTTSTTATSIIPFRATIETTATTVSISIPFATAIGTTATTASIIIPFATVIGTTSTTGTTSRTTTMTRFTTSASVFDCIVGG